MTQRDYYQILGVDNNADSKKIKEAYRKQAFTYHPDRNKENPEAAEKMKIVNEAYAVLSSPEKRREYDTLKHQFGSDAYSRFRNNYSQQDIFSGSDINHVFEEMAKAFGFRSFDDIFTEFYGKEYRRFEFKRPGMFAGGFVFTGPLRRGKYDQSQLPPLTGRLGKLSRYVIEKISGVEFPENGADINKRVQKTGRQNTSEGQGRSENPAGGNG